MRITPVLGLNAYKSKDGRYPLHIRVHHGQIRKLIPVGARLKPSEWDAKNGRVKSHPNATTINLKIIELVNSIERNYLKDESMDAGDKEDFYWWFEERIKFSETKFSPMYVDMLTSVMRKLKGFAPTLNIRQLDTKFLMDYEKHLLSTGNSLNTIQNNMKRIRIIVNMLLANHKIQNNPFRGFSIKSTRALRSRVGIDIIDTLIETDFSISPGKELAVDMYLYSFFNAGIRPGDLCRLKKTDVVNGRLRYQMHKTMIDRSIKQMPQALKILAKYAKVPGIHLFPTKVEWRKNDSRAEVRKEDRSINSRITYYNKMLKQVCEDDLFIPKFTLHTARHSFSDYTKKKKFGKKFDVHTLKDLLGHKKVSTTEIYMRDFYEEESDKAMGQLFGSGKKRKDPLTIKPGKNGKRNQKKK